MATAMWGSSDMQLVDMVRRLVYVAMTTRPEAAARLAERSIDQSDAVTHRQADVARTGSLPLQVSLPAHLAVSLR